MRNKELQDTIVKLEEVKLLRNNCQKGLFLTRYKLAPYLSQGFNYIDRRKKTGGLFKGKTHHENKKDIKSFLESYD